MDFRQARIVGSEAGVRLIEVSVTATGDAASLCHKCRVDQRHEAECACGKALDTGIIAPEFLY